MRCAAYLRVNRDGIDSGSDASNSGNAFHEVMKLQNRGLPVNMTAIQAEFALTEAEVKDIETMRWKAARSFEDWNLMSEKMLACDEYLHPVDPESGKAFLTGHPDVVAFHATHTNLCQVLDYKSGRLEQLSFAQLWAYLALVFANFPEVDTIDATFAYVRMGFSTRRKNPDGSPRPWTRDEFTTSNWPHIVAAIKAAKAWRINTQSGFTIGAQCAQCSPWACPAWNQFRRMLQDPNTVPRTLAPEATMAEKASFVVDSLPLAKVGAKVFDELMETIKQIAAQQSVDMGDGTEFCNRPFEMVKFDGALTLPVLVEMAGGSVETVGKILGDVSKSTIYDTVKTLLDEGKITGKKGALNTAAQEKLKSIGALKTENRDRISVYRVEDAVEENDL